MAVMGVPSQVAMGTVKVSYWSGHIFLEGTEKDHKHF